MKPDHFSHKADSYDQDKNKRDNVAQIANAIRAASKLEPAMHIVDFGSGTGLLMEHLAPHVGKITAIDVSPAMNAQLRAKLSQLPCSVEIAEVDLEATSLPLKVDGIVSSMTLHHIQNLPAVFNKLRDMLVAGGFIALADLDKEDGSFHSENEGVYHSGFDRNEIAEVARKAGFKNVAVSTASVINKAGHDFPVFLLVATK